MSYSSDMRRAIRPARDGKEATMRYHSITWQDGNFDSTASVLSFTSQSARAAFPAQCAQRVEAITHKQLRQYLRDGRSQRLMLWDKSEPTRFVAA
jgi:hypothetical protein